MDRTILHCDMNNFYASVECSKNPTLKNIPVAVCGDVEERRGIVLAKNEIAKAFGVATGEPVYAAKKKCPGLVTVPPHHDEYREISRRAIKIYERYTDMIEPFGLDECWLDVSGSLRLFGSGKQIADTIRETIKRELYITASVGVSFNKVFSKLGSDLKKPDATTVISRENFKEQIWGLPASSLLGVGKVTAKKLASRGITTIGQIATWPEDYFENMLGKVGRDLWKYANGLDDAPVITHSLDELDKSCGHGMTARYDLSTNNEVWRMILDLSQKIGHKLYKYSKKATGISVTVKDNRLVSRQWQCKLKAGIQSPSAIARESFALFCRNYDWKNPIRAITVTAIGLTEYDEPEQLGIFSDHENLAKTEALDKAVEEIREKYGVDVIKNAVLLEDKQHSRKKPR